MFAALVVLIMIAISNYSALFFCCFATDYYGLWLQTYHRKDLACLRILVWLCVCVIDLSVLANCVFHLCSTLLMRKVSFFKTHPCEWCQPCALTWWYVQVQNGLALYTTWTAIASLINFSLVLHLWGVDRSTAGTASLCILFGEVMGW